MNKYWFKPKKYGYGYFPISIEGWITTFVLALIIIGVAYMNNMFTDYSITEPTVQDTLRFLFDTAVVIFLSDSFMKSKTDGEIRWRWGE